MFVPVISSRLDNLMFIRLASDTVPDRENGALFSPAPCAISFSPISTVGILSMPFTRIKSNSLGEKLLKLTRPRNPLSILNSDKTVP